MVQRLQAPRAVWLMLPHGDPTESALATLAGHLQPGDVVIDGGNTLFHDDLRRAKTLAERGIDYLDVGVSGGVWGLERGYCLMIGGNAQAVQRLGPIFEALAPGSMKLPRSSSEPRQGTAEQGWLHCGPVGAGHFVKMIHNGIEYGVMQALAEGFDLLRTAAKPHVPAEHRFDFNLADIAEVWRRGSVLSSWLLDLTAIALLQDGALENFSGVVPDSGEGRWTLQTAIEEEVPVPVLSAALYARFRSRQDHTFGEKLLSALRYQFGGHKESDKKP
jgi:6-phosphogluconate dehydrogenase